MPPFTSKEKFDESAELKQYKKAQKYANYIIKDELFVNPKTANLKKLEGIQQGIEVFEGLNIRQIFLLYKYLELITLQRGCSNGCIHCFADAKPLKINTSADFIQTISWEDFQKLTTGFETLNSRLGYNSKKPCPIGKNFVVPFLDADSMEIVLKDNNGTIHDMVEIADVFKQKMGKKILFDTVGWNPKNNKMQQRAEKYVQYITNGGQDNFIGINISLNPFHKLNAKYIEYIKSDPQKALIFRNLYTDRMANTFYTFTPLFKLPQFRVLNRALSEDSPCSEEYKVDAHKQLITEIREKLEKKYLQSGMQKDAIREYISLFDEKTGTIADNRLKPIGRMKQLFPKESKDLQLAEQQHKKNILYPIRIFKKQKSALIMDCNGKIYITDKIYDLAPTDISLNLIGKHKRTPEFYSMVNKKITTQEMINLDKKSVRAIITQIKYGILKIFHF